MPRRYLFTIGPEHVGLSQYGEHVQNLGFHPRDAWRLLQTMGQILPGDIGKQVYDVDGVWQVENDEQRDKRLAATPEGLLRRIAAALDTEESGDALVEVARIAHRAELELYATERCKRERNAFTLTFATDNAAFEDDPRRECRSILRKVVEQLGEGLSSGAVMDRNGNSIGRWQLDASETL